MSVISVVEQGYCLILRGIMENERTLLICTFSDNVDGCSLYRNFAAL